MGVLTSIKPPAVGRGVYSDGATARYRAFGMNPYSSPTPRAMSAVRPLKLKGPLTSGLFRFWCTGGTRKPAIRGQDLSFKLKREPGPKAA